ncbi:hypothetical protein [uncultured Tenacibaculum sp.]|uniref:hypothetical protein n=1 Tax=uncultured Tenacibaculum sp. TaxID=174713 RepID=UPI002610B0EC|nr:hypothetical protein [uncultured Tenacibaculum sp.]
MKSNNNKNSFILSTLVCLFFFTATAIAQTKAIIQKQHKHGFVSYKINQNYVSKAITQKTVDTLKSKTKEHLNSKDRFKELDSTMIKIDSLFRPVKERTVNLPLDTVSYYFFNDTIRIHKELNSSIYIPENFQRFKTVKRKNKTIKYVDKLKDLYETLDVDYQIKIDKNDTKEILRLQGYKIIINENIKSSSIEESNRYELYVSDKNNFPFMYYDFLKLKRKINLKGLILECKLYSDNIKGTLQYTLDNYNTNKQDHKLIEIDFKSYTKY